MVPQRNVLDWTPQIAQGLAAAHAKGIVHHDLKPEILFLLEREPASAILPSFALPVIERYFPEYPSAIREWL